MKTENTIHPSSGYMMLALTLAAIGGGAFLLAQHYFIVGGLLVAAGLFLTGGFIIINPNESNVLVLFGEYKGTVRSNGFFWVNPFFNKRKISLRARNMDSQPIKVNDKLGNPIMIGIVLVWRVAETFKAAFEVDDYESFVKIQSEAAIRKLAGTYPYDNFDDASEIAGAMLQRQQATAIVAARTKIVEGAVGMVDLALKKLAQEHIIELDDEKKAAMVSNLMVVLCSDKAANPVINTGTLHQ
jgi:regulator of protease activity HflC (stomatin/prohibitin superfamily)